MSNDLSKGIFVCINKQIFHLFVWYVTFLTVLIGCQITKMYQHGKNIIFASQDVNIVQKPIGIYIHMLPCEHTGDTISLSFLNLVVKSVISTHIT